MIEGTPIPPTIGHFKVGLKTDLIVNNLVLALKGLVLDAYTSPIYASGRTTSWVVLVSGKVVQVFPEDVELMTAQRVELSTVPDKIKKYILPDRRGFTTMPYQRE